MITLQNFIAPEREICTETDLYVHEIGSVGYDFDTGHYVLPRSSGLNFDSYFNLFDLTQWGACSLDGLFLELTGTGEVEIQITLAQAGRSHEIVHREITTWDDAQPHLCDLSACLNGGGGVLFVRLTALSDRVTLKSARFATPGLPERALPQLTVSITTFQREAEVQATVARLERFLATFPFGAHIRVQVVDNGDSTDIPQTDHVTTYPNRNLGGAGGFARGLLEAEAAGASHCLFMDDDASFHMENIARTYMFLALARDPKTAIAGAMINNTHKWTMWENGAWFNGACRPISNGTDLRDPNAVLQMQFDAAGPQPETVYGGWWFFAYPLAQVSHYPFPFFVRGDDISFSLANDFRIQTLNGVVSFQDDFTEKESAQTLYLDIRNHIVQHLTHDTLARSAFGTARVPLRFIIRSLLRMHYATAEAQLLAWHDVMSGPEFFDTHIDMSARRAAIKALAADEAWQPIAEQPHQERHSRLTRLPRPLRTRIGLVTLNGHIIPFWSRFASHLRLKIGQRGLVYFALGAARVTYMNTDQDKAYTVRHDKKRFYAILWQMIRTTWAFCRNFDTIKAAYHTGYQDMTQKSYWERTLAPGDVEDTRDAPQPGQSPAS